jgi:hypothetical protein
VRRTLVAGDLHVGFDDPFAERNDNVKPKDEQIKS